MGRAKGQREIREDAPNLAGPAPESERYPSRRDQGSRVPTCASDLRGGFRAVGVAVSKLTAPIVARRGGGILVRLKAEWLAIVGPDWAEVAWPSALGRDGVLKLRSIPAAALELQHRAPLVIERINLFFGRPVITRLALVQGPLPFVPPSTPVIRSLTPAEAKALDERLCGVADPELRAALARFGTALSGREC
jgi:hypothetical protein